MSETLPAGKLCKAQLLTDTWLSLVPLANADARPKRQVVQSRGFHHESLIQQCAVWLWLAVDTEVQGQAQQLCDSSQTHTHLRKGRSRRWQIKAASACFSGIREIMSDSDSQANKGPQKSSNLDIFFLHRKDKLNSSKLVFYTYFLGLCYT